MTLGRSALRRTMSSVLCLVTMYGLMGCVDDSGGSVEDLPRMSRAEAMRKADEYANRTVALIGGGVRLDDPATGTPPCNDPNGMLSETVYHASGHYNIAPIPEDQQLATLRRLRDLFRQQGFTIKHDRVLPDGKTGELTVANPADDFEISLISTEPAIAFAVTISSPCYYSDEPDPPAASGTPDR